MNHKDAVALIQQEIDGGSSRADTLIDCINRGHNLNIFLRRMTNNNFCIAIVDFGPDGKAETTWIFDLIDCPIIFLFFKEKGITEKIFIDTVGIALTTLEQIRVVLDVEKDLKDIIHLASEPRDESRESDSSR